MRAWIVGLAILAAACSVETNGHGGRGGYTVDIRAADNEAVYVVTAPDGRVAAARSHEGTSAMLDPQALQQALAAMPAPSTNSRYDDHEVSIRAPGFSLQASGDDDGENTDSGADHRDRQATTTTTTTATTASGEKPAASSSSSEQHGRGHVSMNIGGFSMDAEGNGDDGNGRAHVHFAGLSAHDARHFITDADELSPQVQAQMLTALGLSQDDK
ncbi:MAG: hypothetical protein HY054_05470 [Proteobacteria bacterium]|nr:hypothetical protein [Pseudomonadota bacterium]